MRSPLSVEGMKVAEFSLKEHDKMIIRKRERQRIRLEMSAESLRLVDVGGEVEGNVEEEACEILESDMTKVICTRPPFRPLYSSQVLPFSENRPGRRSLSSAKPITKPGSTVYSSNIH